MKIIKYPDGTSYVESNYKMDTSFKTFKLNTYEDLWHLNQFVDVLNHNNRRPVIIIPNLIDAQADRRFAEDQSTGLKLVCKFLNNLKADFKIFHPHNPEVVEALIDNVEIIDNSRFISEVLFHLKDGFPVIMEDEYHKTTQGFHFDKRIMENTILMSSDAGGFKPLMKLCDILDWKGETFSASKFRSQYQANNNKGGSTKLIQTIGREDFEGKDILLIDDISVHGGTFKGLANLLKERNCGKLYLAVSHMTIQNLGDDPVTNYFDKVFTTNSKFDNYFVADKKGEPKSPENLEIIKLF